MQDHPYFLPVKSFSSLAAASAAAQPLAWQWQPRPQESHHLLNRQQPLYHDRYANNYNQGQGQGQGQW